MTASEFKGLSRNDQTRFILRVANYLTSIIHNNYRIELYSISDFFVEVKVGDLTGNFLDVKVVTGEELDKFINNIELPGLL